MQKSRRRGLLRKCVYSCPQRLVFPLLDRLLPLEALESRLLLSIAPADAVPDLGLAATSVVGGIVFNDQNSNSTRDAVEPPLANWLVFLDDDGDGFVDTGERVLTTDSNGRYNFTGLSQIPYRIVAQPQDAWTATLPNTAAIIPVPGTNPDVNFAFHTSVPVLPVEVVGGEFRVNTTLAADQLQPASAMYANGDFIVTWAAQSVFAGASHIYAQRYESQGVKQGGEFLISNASFLQRQPEIAIDPDGDFVITWQSQNQDGSGYGIYARRFNASGVAQGAEFLVNTYTSGDQWVPAVGMDAAGRFVIAWQSDGQDGNSQGVYAQMYNAAGQRIGNEFQVHTQTDGPQRAAGVAMNPSGSFVITWGDGVVPKFQLYGATGGKIGGETSISTSVSATNVSPAIAMDPTGDFVVTWDSYGGDNSRTAVLARRFNAAGVPQGGEFRVNTITSDYQYEPDVAADASGDFIIAWSSRTDGDQDGVYAQRFNSAGLREGGELRINTYIASRQIQPTVAMDLDDNIVIAWTSYQQDGSGAGIYAQRYRAILHPAQLGGTIWNDANGNGLQDPTETTRDGVTVNLLEGSVIVATTTTSGGGNYRFDSLVPGRAYVVAVPAPTGLGFTLRRQGGDDAIDSDIIVATGQSDPVVLTADQSLLTVGAGLVPLVSVGNFVWNDTNANGIQDAGETGRNGVVVKLFTAGGILKATTTTSGGGLYRFDAVNPGVGYFLEFTPQNGFVLTAPDQGSSDALDSDVDVITRRTPVFVPSFNQSDFTLDAGIVPAGSISGVIYYDANPNGLLDPGEIGLDNWTLFIDANENGRRDDGEPSYVTAPDGTGAFTFSNLAPTTYHIAVVNQNKWTPPAPLTVVLKPGQNLTGVQVGNQTAVPPFFADPAGGDFIVTGAGLNQKRNPVIAADAAGNFIVVWEADATDTVATGIFAQRYSAQGDLLGPAFRVNTTAVPNAAHAAVAMESTGEFVIAWDGNGILAQRFGANATPIGTEFRVNPAVATDGHDTPTIAIDADGDFVVAWERIAFGPSGTRSYGVYAQRYNAAGDKVGQDFLVGPLSTSGYGIQQSDIAMDPAGDFIITWENSQGIFAQRYTPAGAKAGATFQINDFSGSHRLPAVTMDAEGNSVIAWFVENAAGVDIYAQRYDSSGALQGSAFKLNTTPLTSSRGVNVAADPDGDFIVTWYSSQDHSYSLYGQRFNAAGLKQGQEFLIRSSPGPILTDYTQYPAIAASASGDYIIAWRWSTQSAEGISAQRFTRFADPGQVGGTVWRDVNGNGIREAGEAPIAGVTVKLLSENGALVRTAISAPDGSYRFDGLRPLSPYTIQVTPPAGLVVTLADQGSDDSLDSDLDPLTGRLQVILQANQFAATTGIGLTSPASISGSVFSDRDRDGARDADEIGLGGWIVFDDFDNDGQFDDTEPFTVSDSDGNYTLGSLPPGAHHFFAATQDLWSPTTAGSQLSPVLRAGQSTTGINIGNHTDVLSLQAPPQSPQAQLNQSPSNSTNSPVIAMDANGDYAAVWTRNGDIYGRLFTFAGVPRGNEFIVNTFTNGTQSEPAVAMDANGNFVVTWWTAFRDGFGLGIAAQRFNASGARLGSEFQVNTLYKYDQRNPAIAMTPDGGFIIAWYTYDSDVARAGGNVVSYRRFTADGNPMGDENRLDYNIIGDATEPSVAAGGDGSFVLAWSGGINQPNIFLQRFNPSGAALGPVVQANRTTGTGAFNPVVAMDRDGRFTLAWTTFGSSNAPLGVYLQRFNADGVPQGSEFRANSFSNATQRFPSIATGANGDIVVTWTSTSQDGNSDGVYMQRYNAAGLRIGPETLVNTTTLRNQQNPAVAMDADGDFAIVWSQPNPDPDFFGNIYVQRYRADRPPKAQADLATLAEDSDVSIAVLSNDSDADNDSLAVSVLSSTHGLALVNDAGTPANLRDDFIVFTPAPDYHGPAIVLYQIDDGKGGLATASISITVTPVADTPSVTGAATDEDNQTTSGLVLSRNPVDGQEVTNFKITQISNGKLYFNDGVTPINDGDFITFAQGHASLKFTPSDNFFGLGGFEIQASTAPSDAGLGGATIHASIAIAPVADTPSATPAVTDEDTQTTSGLVLSRNPVDGQEVTHFKITQISNGKLYLNDGVTPINDGGFITFAQGHAGLKFTPAANFSGIGSFIIQASLSPTDQGIGGESAVASISVAPVNDRPIADDVSVSVTEDGRVAITLSANDVETFAEALTFTITSLPQHGTLWWGGTIVLPGQTFTGAPGSLQYESGCACDDAIADSFTYTVTDTGDPAGTPANVLTSLPAAVNIALIPAINPREVRLDAGGILRVGGTASADNIAIRRTTQGNLRISFGDTIISESIRAADVLEIRIWGRAGDDRINLADLPIKAYLSGSAGRDTLMGSAGSNILIGGSGDDQLDGGAGADMLIGGSGSDRLHGEGGGDILIGGQTSCTLTLGTLRRIVADWHNLTVPIPPLDSPAAAVDFDEDTLITNGQDNWLIVSADDTLLGSARRNKLGMITIV